MIQVNRRKLKSESLDYELIDYGEEIPVIDEDTCKLLNEDEICSIAHNKELAFIFDKNQFLKAFSEIFRSKSYVFKSTKKDNSNETIIFKGEDYSYIIEKLRRHYMSLSCKPPETNDEKTEYEIAILVHPIKRNVSVINNRTLKEEKFDILDLIERDKNFIDVREILYRTTETLQKEWDKLHKDKKPIYIH